MDLEGTLFVLRISAVGILYLFIIGVVVAASRDIRTAAPESSAQSNQDGMVVLDGGATNLPRGTVLPLIEISSVGRLPQSTVYLDDESVSGRHATIRRRKGQWWVEDLGSTNGTYVDGQPVNHEIPLPVGSILTVGRIRLTLETQPQ